MAIVGVLRYDRILCRSVGAVAPGVGGEDDGPESPTAVPMRYADAAAADKTMHWCLCLWADAFFGPLTAG